MDSSLLMEPVTIGKLKFKKFLESERKGFKKLLLYASLCNRIEPEHARQLTHYLPTYPFDGALRQPSSEFIEWAEGCGVEFVVDAVFVNGCSIYLMNRDDVVMIKLKWGPNYIG